MATVRFQRQARRIERKVRYTGTDALVKGEGLYYDRDTGTATEVDGRRDKNVERGTTINNMWFAGTLQQSYSANSSGQWVRINEPGSVCDVLVGADTTVKVTVLTCTVQLAATLTSLETQGQRPLSGRFIRQGLPGRGTALALETKTDSVLFSDLTGDVGTYVASTGVITASGAGSSAGTAAGDKVLMVAGGTDAGTTSSVKLFGEYPVTSVTAGTTTITSDSTNEHALDYEGLAHIELAASESETCFMYLYNGEESGAVEFLSPIDNSTADAMVGGTTLVVGGYTLTSGTSNHTFADSVIFGQQKLFVCLGALTSNGWVAIDTSNNIQFAPGSGTITNVQTIVMAATTDGVLLEAVALGNWVVKWAAVSASIT